MYVLISDSSKLNIVCTWYLYLYYYLNIIIIRSNEINNNIVILNYCGRIFIIYYNIYTKVYVTLLHVILSEVSISELLSTVQIMIMLAIRVFITVKLKLPFFLIFCLISLR